MELTAQLHTLATSAPGTQWIRGLVAPRANMNMVVKRRIPVLAKNQTLVYGLCSVTLLTKQSQLTALGKQTFSYIL